MTLVRASVIFFLVDVASVSLQYLMIGESDPKKKKEDN
jgi:hypothetical protein